MYRNLVKALPWFSDVRAKINDPAYSGWFLHTAHGQGSGYYHDSEQTPHGDCGGVVCGEYLWDHRNQSLRAFLVDTIIAGTCPLCPLCRRAHTYMCMCMRRGASVLRPPAAAGGGGVTLTCHVTVLDAVQTPTPRGTHAGPDAMGNPAIDGLFLDDFWTNFPYKLPWATDPKRDCSLSPTGGPTEVAGGCIDAMGLSAADVQDIASNWQVTMRAVFAKIVTMKGFAWQLFHQPDQKLSTSTKPR